MYDKILVPLDGSALAECVLPHVETVVKGCSVPEICLLRVAEPVRMSFSDLSAGGYVYTDETTFKLLEEQNKLKEKEATEYLTKMSVSPVFNGARVTTVVGRGFAADFIADYVKNNGIDLVIIATHGRSGVSRWVWGSTADKILHSTCAPVFMVRAPGCEPGI